MDFLKQYLKVICYVCTGLVFAFASFYILANLYHYYELRKDYITSYNNEYLSVEIDETLSKVQSNLSSYKPNSYKGNVSNSNMQLITQRLSNCVSAFNNETINNIRNKNKITIIDVYNLRESYENDILNNCVVANLYWLTEIDESFGSTYLLNNRDVTKLYIDSLLTSYTSYLKKDLLNNSSYYYNTSIASSSVKDNTRDGFYEVMDAYNRVAKLVLYVSEWYKMEAGV